jgi:hypothetical protein
MGVQSGRRALVGVAAMAAVALGGAHAVEAAVAPARSDAPSVVVTPPSPPPSAVPERESGVASPARQQRLELAIDGGDLVISPSEARVVLRRVPGSDRLWMGELAPVRVVDARGVPDGWAVRWSVRAVHADGAEIEKGPGLRVEVTPSEPDVICCGQESVHAGDPRPAHPHGRVLFRADTGTGGGTFQIGASVRTALPPSLDPDQLAVTLSFAIG